MDRDDLCRITDKTVCQFGNMDQSVFLDTDVDKAAKVGDVGHDADVIAHMSDRAALMSEGKIQRFFDRDAMEKGEHRMD